MKLAATEVVMRAFRRAPDGLQWFANLSLSTDAMGMPVVAMNGGRIHIGYYRIDTIPEQVSHLVASYGLTEQIVDELLFMFPI